MVDTRIQSYGTKEVIDGRLYDVHYYTRYIGKHTELYTFGDGLGDQACMMQVGDCFLELMDEDKDPHLGRISMSFGGGVNSYKNYYGDHVIKWVWGVSAKELEGHLGKHSARPDLILSPHDPILERAEELGYRTLYWHSGVNPRMFKPLGFKRHGVGYRGVKKSKEQQRIMLDPAEDFDFERIHFTLNEKHLKIPEYNAWLNTKKVVLGMVSEDRHSLHYIPTRFFECMASGTPLVTYKLPYLESSLDIKYPFMSTSPEETRYWIQYIMDEWDTVHPEILSLSNLVRTKHSYKHKLEELFEVLSNE